MSYLTINEQLNLLSQKSICIGLEEEAKDILQMCNYYSLMKYRNFFYKSSNNVLEIHKYKENTNLKDIFALYEIDRLLNIYFDNYIKKFRNRVTALLMDDLVKYCEGYKEINYLNKEYSFVELYSDIISYKKIATYKLEHNFVPLWMLLDATDDNNFFKVISKILSKQKFNAYTQLSHFEVEKIHYLAVFLEHNKNEIFLNQYWTPENNYLINFFNKIDLSCVFNTYKETFINLSEEELRKILWL